MKNDNKVQASKEVEDALETFIPDFGNEKDLRIKQIYEEVIRIKSSSKKLGPKALEDLKHKEETIIHFIKERNK